MYYVLFNYTDGPRAKDFVACRTEDDVIAFLHNHYKGIEVIEIVEVKASYRLGLTVTEDYIKSELEPKEEPESLVPVEVVNNAEAILKEKKRKLKELKTEEPSAMEKIIEDAEEEIKEDKLTPEQRTQKSLDDADDVIAREKKRQEQAAKGWALCTDCNSNRVAPWNEKGICSECQNKKKTNRPYVRKKEFLGPTEGCVA